MVKLDYVYSISDNDLRAGGDDGIVFMLSGEAAT